LHERDEFIESLTHDSAIIQIPALKDRRRDRLEKMLAVFDQARINPQNHHLLRVDDADYPEECQAVLRRLTLAVSQEQVRQKMTVEDEIVSELEERDRREQHLAEKVEAERKLKEMEQSLKEEERKLKEEACRREQKERLEKEKALAELAELKRKLGQMDE